MLFRLHLRPECQAAMAVCCTPEYRVVKLREFGPLEFHPRTGKLQK